VSRSVVAQTDIGSNEVMPEKSHQLVWVYDPPYLDYIKHPDLQLLLVQKVCDLHSFFMGMLYASTLGSGYTHPT